MTYALSTNIAKLWKEINRVRRPETCCGDLAMRVNRPSPVETGLKFAWPAQGILLLLSNSHVMHVCARRRPKSAKKEDFPIWIGETCTEDYCGKKYPLSHI